jgi:hypothetical protein
MSDQPRPTTPPSESSHPKSSSWADDESDDEASAREFQAAMTPKKSDKGGVVGMSERAREECEYSVEAVLLCTSCEHGLQ